MKYKTKIYLTIVGVSSALLILSSTVFIVEARNFVFQLIEEEGISVASSAASEIDGNLLEQIKTRGDEQNPGYEEIREQLRKIRNSNRNKQLYIKYLYTLYPDEKNPNHFFFGVDSEENPKYWSQPGDAADGAAIDRLGSHHLAEYSRGRFTTDEWGTWLTGYAPVYNSEGKYVGSVGADIGADFIHHVIRRLIFEDILILGLSIVISLIFASLLAERVTRSLRKLRVATEEIGKGNFEYTVNLHSKDEFQDLGESLHQMSAGLLERERLKVGFAHYLSKSVLEKILAGGGCKLEGERRKITVLFSDIRGFTRIAESLTPEEVMSILNEYFEEMLGIVFSHNGVLDKMIGDAIMAEYGIATDDPEQEKNAVLTAIEMQQALLKLREKWRSEGKPEISVGIGVHTGEAIVGTVGSKSRMQFTAIGDTVNVASRLERITREYHEQIIVSKEVHEALKGAFVSKDLGQVHLTGKEKSIEAYAIEVPTDRKNS